MTHICLPLTCPLEQWLSKCSSWASKISITWELVRMQVPQHPHYCPQLNEKNAGQRSVSNKPAGDADARWSARPLPREDLCLSNQGQGVLLTTGLGLTWAPRAQCSRDAAGLRRSFWHYHQYSGHVAFSAAYSPLLSTPISAQISFGRRESELRGYFLRFPLFTVSPNTALQNLFYLGSIYFIVERPIRVPNPPAS